MEAQLWFPEPVHTPNAIALDETHLYFVETFRSSICRIEIRNDGTAGAFERIIHARYQVPDGFAFDEEGRLWIAFHRPDAIKVLDFAHGSSRLSPKIGKATSFAVLPTWRSPARVAKFCCLRPWGIYAFIDLITSAPRGLRLQAPGL
jgi:sugar lactone lactonase YvrE